MTHPSERKRQEIQKTVDLLRLQRKALATERCYVHWLGSFIDWLVCHGAGFPDSRSRIEAYLTALAHRGVAASTQNQAFNAIRYYYAEVRKEPVDGIEALRASQPKRHRTAIPRVDTLRLLAATPDVAGYPTALVAKLLYGCGLRVSEALNLRVKDLDVPGSRLVIREAKGNKDRVVVVPCSLMPAVQEQLVRAKVIWQADQLRKLPVQLPGELAAKYRNAPFSWQWAWIFPAHHPCDHPRTGARVRYRMHEANVQRAVREAAVSIGMESVVTPHVLRHCWATHVIEAGASLRDVQERMGHKSIETTMGYVLPNASRIPAVL